MGRYWFLNLLLLSLNLNFIESSWWPKFCWKCCIDTSKVNDLGEDLASNLYGQHLVLETVLSAVFSHIKHEPRKALVMSFHGPAGVGKTFVARKIGHHLFEGDSRYVKFYSGRNDFIENTDIAVHKVRLSQDIENTVYACPNAVFIFDEADQMADGLFDVLRPYTDYFESYHGIDFRKAIFIFMSNIGASEIAATYHNKKGKREDLTLQDFEGNLSLWLYNKPGGFNNVALITNFLVDYYLPFLPLEEEHIKQCIKSSLIHYNHQATSEIVQAIYNLLPVKKSDGIEYIPSNCKKIGTEVGKYIATKERLAMHKAKLNAEL